MDLVAGSDWQFRLWNSLLRAQAAIIDLSDETPFVVEECGLANQAIGIRRLIFIGIEPQTEEELHRRATEILDLQADRDQLHIVIWPENATWFRKRDDKRRFRAQIKEAFREILDEPKPTLLEAPAQLRMQKKTPTYSDARMWRAFVICYVTVWIADAVISHGFSEYYGLWFLLLAVSILLLLSFNWLVYIRDIGVTSERIKALIGLVIVIPAFLWLFNKMI